MLLALALAVAALIGWAAARGRPVPLPDAGVQQLPCVSYAPFRRPGHTPFDEGLLVTPAQIEDDLRRLRGVSGCVRTYGLDHGLDAVPGVARALGMRVLLGAWIGRDPVANDAQLRRALALAREHPDTVALLIVGNEVLLRGELAPVALAGLLARARAGSPVPVAYADVWEFWLRHAAALRPQVDVAAIHVLPYWEDEPVAAADAVRHLQEVSARVRETLAPLPVLVAETGWPAAGRQRGPAAPGREAQARAVRSIVSAALPAPEGLPAFNLIEGFDQPWKRALEGAVGGYWGVFDAEGRQRVSLQGALPAPQGWHQPLAWAGAGALAMLVVAAVRDRRRGAGAVRAAGGLRGHACGPADGPAGIMLRAPAALLMAGAGSGALAALQFEALQVQSRTPLEWTAGIAVALAAVAMALAAALRLAALLERGADALGPRPGLRMLSGRARRRGAAPGDSLLAVPQAALLFGAAAIALQLAFDPRYRPLLWPALAAPAILLAALCALGDRLAADACAERLLAAVCAAAALWVLHAEGLRNAQALGAAACWLAIAWATLMPHGARSGGAGGASPDARSQPSADSSTAGADGPAA
ncbi:MAG: hypothetical protein ACLGII_04950 [Gammaproteobacteria bacterium]